MAQSNVNIVVSEQGRSGERDRVDVLMSLLGIERWEAEAIMTGQYTIRDPLFGFCAKRFGNYEEIAKLLLGWVGWSGELRAASPSLAADVAARMPWLWQEGGHGVKQFPRVCHVTCEQLSEVLLQEQNVTWLGDLFRRHCVAVTERERTRLTETVEGREFSAQLLDESRFPQFNPEDAPMLWGEDGSALRERWRFLGFSDLPLPEKIQAEIWRSFELSMQCAVELRSLHREGEFHELTTQAVAAMCMWKDGAFPLFLSGTEPLYTLYVLVASGE